MAPYEAARRVAAGADPIWVSSPGPDPANDVAIASDVVGADPVSVVRGDSIVDLERGWVDARRRWSAVGQPPEADIPVGVGWLSYDLARRWIPLDGRAADDRDWPLLEFRFFDALWIQNTDRSGSRIVACDQGAADRLLARLTQVPPEAQRLVPRLGRLESPAVDAKSAAHTRAVERIQEYLHAGDTYQVNLARRLTAPVSDGDPVWLAAALRESAPACHAIWLGARSKPGGPIDRYVVGNSPERFLHMAPDGTVETRPIKGTRPRGTDAASDAAARVQLSGAAKDRAEHVMIVDLERNDLGRVCRTGSVVVDGLLRVLELPTLFHLVSTVRGLLRPDVGLEELIRATFPGGSVTGAPKRRAMQIIEELEPVRRGIYTGATGWLGAAGDLDLAVAIRTAVVAMGHLSLFVGGGIVSDSDPIAEWDETEVKARAFLALCDRPVA
jgi:anthranilate/para-aminobenzoate synthase component I